MKIKTSELIGSALDWAVAVCEGHKPPLLRILRGKAALPDPNDPMGCDYLEYSIDPAQAWPIIERLMLKKGLVLRCWVEKGQCDASLDFPHRFSFGPTPLIAAMRCYVASKMGDEIEIPEELI